MQKEEILKNYFSETHQFVFSEIGQGAINDTYRVGGGVENFILQKMGPIFHPKLSEDVEAITSYLYLKDFPTTRLVRTLSGELFVIDGDSWWRLLTYVEGETYEYVTSIAQARSAGRLVGAFHLALSDCEHKFNFSLPNFHDIPHTMQVLRNVLSKNIENEKYNKIASTAEKILTEYEKIKLPENLPKRIIHGDLKISNIRFDTSGEALSLIDLDTLMRSTLAVELGDALRSWCMPGGEDAEIVRFDRDIYNGALEGYFSSATFITDEEISSIPQGVKAITLELSARFLTDAFNEKYFRHDRKKYHTLYEQNKKRAENQLAFYFEFSKSMNF